MYAAAAVVETPAGQQLVAYLTPASVDLDAVKHSVAQALPEFMRPGMWMLLDEMPLSSAGKIVRQQLPAPTVDTALAVAAHVVVRRELAVLGRPVAGLPELLTGRQVVLLRVVLGGEGVLAGLTVLVGLEARVLAPFAVLVVPVRR